MHFTFAGREVFVNVKMGPAGKAAPMLKRILYRGCLFRQRAGDDRYGGRHNGAYRSLGRDPIGSAATPYVFGAAGELFLQEPALQEAYLWF